MNEKSRRFSKFLIGSSLGVLVVLALLNLAMFGQSQVNMVSRADDIQVFTKEFDYGEANLVLENYLENSEEDYRYARIGIEMRSTEEVYVIGLIDYDLTFSIDGLQVFSQKKPIYGYFYQDLIEDVKIEPGEHLSVKGTVNAYFVIDGDIEAVQFSIEMNYSMEFSPLYEELPLALIVTLAEVLLFLTSASLLFLGQQWNENRKLNGQKWGKLLILPQLVHNYQ
ncbi:hypothetical protein [Candidatus Lokiarchaeum ossiferum]|uniref:hypothetical protein n=1 Tax=Candidatus Lokiarchaeum ossiferum TaxID=2951803 RepID=UPI00352E7B25